MSLANRAARGLVVTAAALALVALAACGGKVKVKEPAKLVEIKKPEVRPVEAWSQRVGNGSEDSRLLDGSFLFQTPFYSGLRLDIEQDALYAAAIDGSVYALNPKTGAPIWRTETKSRVISGPTVADDKVYVGTLDGDAIALQRSSGKELWRANFRSEVGAAPVASGNVVVVRTIDGREFGLSAADGSRIWSFDRTVPNLTLRGLSEPLILGNRVYTGLDNGKLAALGLADGQLAWEQNISVPTGRSELERLTDIDADLLAGDNGIFVVTYGNDVALIDPIGGDSRWRRSIKSYTSMASDGKHLFVTDDDGLLWAIDADTGAAVWKQEVLKYRRLSPPAVFGNYVVVGDFKGYLHWFELSEGRLVARTHVGSAAITTAPVSDGTQLYVTDSTGHVIAYQAKPAK
ncbi:MAG: outer membrane protein assembly factor BamB [Nevskia sp.]